MSRNKIIGFIYCCLLFTLSALIASCSRQSRTGALSSTVPISCPTGYIPIAHNDSYTLNDFCVMQYEAKLLYDADGDGDFLNAVIEADGNFDDDPIHDYDSQYETDKIKFMAISDPTGRPWVNIKRGENGAATGQGAIEACQELGDGYDLISVDEWQTIARDIEATASNWVVDSVGDTVINRGHSDANPNISCDASNEYVQTDCANSGNEPKAEQKRTHTLSSGEVIWDLAGNGWEWVKDNSISNAHAGTSLTWLDIDVVTYPLVQTQLGPLDLSNPSCDDPAGPNKCGFGMVYDGSAGAVYRGGGPGTGVDSGLFAAALSSAPTASFPNLTFRCVYRP